MGGAGGMNEGGAGGTGGNGQGGNANGGSNGQGGNAEGGAQMGTGGIMPLYGSPTPPADS